MSFTVYQLLSEGSFSLYQKKAGLIGLNGKPSMINDTNCPEMHTNFQYVNPAFTLKQLKHFASISNCCRTGLELSSDPFLPEMGNCLMAPLP